MDKHPFKRVRESLSLTQSQLAREAQITEQTVLKTEQGLYTFPPVGIIRVLSELSRESEIDLYTWYNEFQKIRRSETRPVLESAISRFATLKEGIGGTHEEFRQLVTGESQQQYCRFLCIHPAQLSRYERIGGELPNFLLNAYQDVRMEEGCLKKLKSTVR